MSKNIPVYSDFNHSFVEYLSEGTVSEPQTILLCCSRPEDILIQSKLADRLESMDMFVEALSASSSTSLLQKIQISQRRNAAKFAIFFSDSNIVSQINSVLPAMTIKIYVGLLPITEDEHGNLNQVQTMVRERQNASIKREVISSGIFIDPRLMNLGGAFIDGTHVQFPALKNGTYPTEQIASAISERIVHTIKQLRVGKTFGEKGKKKTFPIIKFDQFSPLSNKIAHKLPHISGNAGDWFDRQLNEQMTDEELAEKQKYAKLKLKYMYLPDDGHGHKLKPQLDNFNNSLTPEERNKFYSRPNVVKMIDDEEKAWQRLDYYDSENKKIFAQQKQPQQSVQPQDTFPSKEQYFSSLPDYSGQSKYEKQEETPQKKQKMVSKKPVVQAVIPDEHKELFDKISNCFGEKYARKIILSNDPDIIFNSEQLVYNFNRIKIMLDRSGYEIDRIVSLYRTDEENNKCDGKQMSFHRSCGAIDFSVKGMTPKQLYNFILDLMKKKIIHKGGIHAYDTEGNSFVHYDFRGHIQTWK